MNKKIFSIFLAIFLVLSVHVYSLLPYEGVYVDVYSVFYHIAGLIVVVSGIYAVIKYGANSPKGRVYLYLSTGLGFWFIADVIYTVLEMKNIDAFPSCADFFYLAGYPWLTIGIFKELKMQKVKFKIAEAWRFYILAFLMVLTAAFVLFRFSFDPGNTLLICIINGLYCLGDIILAILIVFILAIIDQYKQGKFSEVWISILIGVLFTFIADMLYSIFFVQYSQGVGLARDIDLVYIISYIFIAYGLFSAGDMVEQAKKKIESGLS